MPIYTINGYKWGNILEFINGGMGEYNTQLVRNWLCLSQPRDSAVHLGQNGLCSDLVVYVRKDIANAIWLVPHDCSWQLVPSPVGWAHPAIYPHLATTKLKLGQLATQATFGHNFPPTCRSHLRMTQVTSAKVQYLPQRNLKVGDLRDEWVSLGDCVQTLGNELNESVLFHMRLGDLYHWT